MRVVRRPIRPDEPHHKLKFQRKFDILYYLHPYFEVDTDKFSQLITILIYNSF